MSVLELRSPLSAEERLEKRKLILRDVTALLSLFAITATLAVLTFFLFNSFSTHRHELAQRWLARGRSAMAGGRPEQAVQALRSALEYEEGQREMDLQRETEIELATALAAAGHDAEATAYFNTLLEAQPGNGLINLQLARLAVKQGHEEQAVESYQRALDGTWLGDGYLRRLSVRLELARYLLSRHEAWRARSELITASGNAPDDPNIKLEIAGLLEQAQDPQDAFEIYRKLALNRPDRLEALEGAGRAAAALNHYLLARLYLTKALDNPGLEARPAAEREAVRNALADTVHLLALYPGPELSTRARAERTLHNVNTARARMTDCSGATPEGNTPALAGLADRWQAVPSKLTVRALEEDPELEQTLMTLVYDTEKTTVQTCGNPTGEDGLLLQIARAPWAVEQQ
jgi:tetratricopeptide (TPR) repeat protein